MKPTSGSPSADQAAQTPNADPVPQPDAEARLEEAFLRHQNELLGTLLHLVGRVEDARDALQETFVKCWRRRGEVDSLRSLKAWIFQVALNTGRDVRRTAWRRKSQAFADGVEAELPAAGESPDDAAERMEELARLRAAVAQLKEEEREVFLLRENGELTYEEIAELVRIPVGTAKTRMRAALAKLRAAMRSRAP